MTTVGTNRRKKLPLVLETPAAWAAMALKDPLALLNDHAHLEKKAATNALELLHRWPDPRPPEHWVQALTVLARDEVEHLELICRLLARRGGRLTKHHRNPYANDLRALVRYGEGNGELIDRLMIGALIEARSAERFELLAEACDDEELVRVYRDLVVADFGHYRIYLDLARKVETKRVVDARWRELLEAEGEVMRGQRAGARMHSWPARS